jgi:hypothetical protein
LGSIQSGQKRHRVTEEKNFLLRFEDLARILLVFFFCSPFFLIFLSFFLEDNGILGGGTSQLLKYNPVSADSLGSPFVVGGILVESMDSVS